MRLLPPEWYRPEDVVGQARALLGKVIRTQIDGMVTSAMMTDDG
jgi:3-methyladenine DNA glycosylase Mpg